jgi:hypothetical protein
MRKHQYRLCQTDRRTFQLLDSRSDLATSVAFDRDDHAVIQTGTERFSIGRAGLRSRLLTDQDGAIVARASLSGIYHLVMSKPALQWNPLSLWHGVYGWTLIDGTIAVRYVPATSENIREYLITVEKPIENELRVVAMGAFLLKLAGTDFVAWSASAGAGEMRE